ncbi:MAG TPA: hypothetical protein VFV34_27590, partial [Blastocatellia bacterium]|nr:hypothetical protein [Blastocatellia bacterium]
MISVALAVNLLIFPGVDQLALQVPPIASSMFDGFTAPLRAIPVVWKRIFQLEPQAPKQETMADRAAKVFQIRLSPAKLTAYVGDRVTFTALSNDVQGQVVHGVKFEWSSSDARKLDIDDAGGAKLLAPGLVTVTCQAGLIRATSVVLIRPGARRIQTDAEWNADQASVSSSSVGLVDPDQNSRSPEQAEISRNIGDPVTGRAVHDPTPAMESYTVGKGDLSPLIPLRSIPKNPESADFETRRAGINASSRPDIIPSRRSAPV